MTFNGTRLSERGQKFNARRTEYNGVVYDSKAEASFAQCLDLLSHAESPMCRVAWWIRQVKFYFPEPWGSHRVDFLVHYSLDDTWDLIEVKGKETPDGKRRRKALEHYLGFKIRVWTKEGWGI